ncbi:MAG: HupE/UreJ family protein [Sphingobacteriales bacterium]|nr:MAG: HupE/UreJ family protein [Sphingobacteriales bacterium]
MKKALLLILFVLICLSADAHVIKYELDRISNGAVFWKYMLVGYEHIIPLGLDHILFILCVFFLNTSIRQIILQASMFTLAHSITLGLAMYGVINPPPNIIEPLIALSIVLLAVENIFSKKVKPWRMVMVFLFGLVHGMGFAGALSELGMPQYAFATALISFNVGVELGQITIILVMYFLVARTFSKKQWYRKAIVIPSSIAIALVASYWTIERIFFV